MIKKEDIEGLIKTYKSILETTLKQGLEAEKIEKGMGCPYEMMYQITVGIIDFLERLLQIKKLISKSYIELQLKVSKDMQVTEFGIVEYQMKGVESICQTILKDYYQPQEYKPRQSTIDKERIEKMRLDSIPHILNKDHFSSEYYYYSIMHIYSEMKLLTFKRKYESIIGETYLFEEMEKFINNGISQDKIGSNNSYITDLIKVHKRMIDWNNSIKLEQDKREKKTSEASMIRYYLDNVPCSSEMTTLKERCDTIYHELY